MILNRSIWVNYKLGPIEANSYTSMSQIEKGACLTEFVLDKVASMLCQTG